jgi:hypothetical protein
MPVAFAPFPKLQDIAEQLQGDVAVDAAFVFQRLRTEVVKKWSWQVSFEQ